MDLWEEVLAHSGWARDLISKLEPLAWQPVFLHKDEEHPPTSPNKTKRKSPDNRNIQRALSRADALQYARSGNAVISSEKRAAHTGISKTQKSYWFLFGNVNYIGRLMQIQREGYRPKQLNESVTAPFN